jgi:hypothetical protein
MAMKVTPETLTNEQIRAFNTHAGGPRSAIDDASATLTMARPLLPLPPLYDHDDARPLCPVCGAYVDLPTSVHNVERHDCSACRVALIIHIDDTGVWLRTLEDELDLTVMIQRAHAPTFMRRLSEGPFVAAFEALSHTGCGFGFVSREPAAAPPRGDLPDAPERTAVGIGIVPRLPEPPRLRAPRIRISRSPLGIRPDE